MQNEEFFMYLQKYNIYEQASNSSFNGSETSCIPKLFANIFENGLCTNGLNKTGGSPKLFSASDPQHC